METLCFFVLFIQKRINSQAFERFVWCKSTHRLKGGVVIRSFGNYDYALKLAVKILFSRQRLK